MNDRSTDPRATDPHATDADDDLDPGAYVGNRPERQAETIPGGVGPDDERIAAHSTQPHPVGGDPVPDGHREGPSADDDAVREAGQSR
jgi:hypothetical protein